MSLLTYNELVKFVEDGHIEGVHPDNINGGSIDLNLAPGFIFEGIPLDDGFIDLGKKETPRMVNDPGDTLLLPPGGFALASTAQVFHLPNDIAGHYMLKSSLARAGMNHLLAGWADPGWHSSALTLELLNVLRYHTMTLKAGDKIGQMVFWRGEEVPEQASYATRGQYNNDLKTTASKGAR